MYTWYLSSIVNILKITKFDSKQRLYDGQLNMQLIFVLNINKTIIQPRLED